MAENSPAFQRRDSGESPSSPEGTAEIDCLSRPSGTHPALPSNPALKRRAIFGCPSGTERASPTSNPVGVGHSCPQQRTSLEASLYSDRAAVRKLLRTGMSALRAKQVQEGESLQVMGVSGCRFTRIKDWWRRAASSRSSSGIAGLPMSNNNEEICSSTKSFRNSVTTL